MKKYSVVLLLGIVIIVGVYWSKAQKPPVPVVMTEKQQLEVVRGSYCWKGFFTSECADTISPPELVKFDGIQPTTVLSESEINIDFDVEPQKNSVNVTLWRENGEIENVPLNQHTFAVPKKKGVYVYAVSAGWDKGDASYAFSIEVQ